MSSDGDNDGLVDRLQEDDESTTMPRITTSRGSKCQRGSPSVILIEGTIRSASSDFALAVAVVVSGDVGFAESRER